MTADEPTFEIIRAGPEDLELLVEGNRAMALETEGLELDLPTLRAGVHAGLSGAQDARYLLARAPDGRVVGQLMLTREWSDWRNGAVWWIQSVYVWPAWRRRGVYRALHEAVIARARAAGAVGIRLYVDARNHAAQAAYRALGMDGDHYRVFEQMRLRPPEVGDR